MVKKKVPPPCAVKINVKTFQYSFIFMNLSEPPRTFVKLGTDLFKAVESLSGDLVNIIEHLFN